MKNSNNDKRFEIVYEQRAGFGRGISILADKETGVNYIFFQSGYGGGLSPLLDSQGKPVITTMDRNFRQY